MSVDEKSGHPHALTYLLTESFSNRTMFQLLKKFTAFYENRMFNAVFIQPVTSFYPELGKYSSHFTMLFNRPTDFNAAF
jgi:hypothetical protein